MPIFALILGSVLEPGHKPRQLFDRFLVGLLTFFCSGQFGRSQHATASIDLQARAKYSSDRGLSARKTSSIEAVTSWVAVLVMVLSLRTLIFERAFQGGSANESGNQGPDRVSDFFVASFVEPEQ